MVGINYGQTGELILDVLREEGVQQHLAKLRAHHYESYTHSLRVGMLATDLGLDYFTDQGVLRELCYGGILHDIGKVQISLGILVKPKDLDKEEWSIMQQHPRLGFEMLSGFCSENVRQIIVAHHEYQIDPYPRNGEERRRREKLEDSRRTRNDEVLEAAIQLVAVADAYDALATPRSYKAALSLEEIEEGLRAKFTGDHKFIDMVLERHEDSEQPV